MSTSAIVAIAVCAVVFIYVVLVFNGLVSRRNRCKEGWSDIETHLKRRYDLIPNLVETVKGYAAHEKETLDRVIQARAAAMKQEGATTAHSQAENMLSSTLKSIFALSENYPDLKANVNFLELQKEITDTEDKIQASRRFYNTVVLDYNNSVEMFPSNIIAGVFRFGRNAFFEVDADEKAAISKPVAVKF